MLVKWNWSRRYYQKYVPYENILLGNTMWTAGLEGPGKVKLFGNGSIDLQNLGAQSEQAVEAVIKVLNNAGWFCCKV